jgi:3-oxoacyl-[acyl-carrier protein] reductase
MSDQKFANKTALVTGASVGLGSEIALGLSLQGAQVIVHFNKNEVAAQDLVKKIAGQGGKALAVGADFSAGNLDEIALKFRYEIISKTNQIDYIVNNAADQSLDPIDPLDETVMNKIMSTNVLAPQAIVKAFLKDLKAGSSIVNITSVEAEHPFVNHSLYAASKAALTRYTELAAVELAATGIRCNCVAPGLVYREDLVKTWPEGLAKWNQKSPMNKPVTAREVSNTVLFLLSSKASGITGTTVTVDGGWSVA